MSLQVIVHYPKSEAEQKKLLQSVSEVHAKYVLDQINKMNLSKEQIKNIISLICDNDK